MPINASFVGQAFPFDEPYAVGAEKIREFAVAIGDDNPLSNDPTAARAAGYPDLVAPPTFAIVVTARAQDALFFNPELGLDFGRVVHGDQRFVHHRPIVAGDVLSNSVHVEGVRVAAGNEIITVRTEVTDPAGQPVCDAYGTLVVRAQQ